MSYSKEKAKATYIGLLEFALFAVWFVEKKIGRLKIFMCFFLFACGLRFKWLNKKKV